MPCRILPAAACHCWLLYDKFPSAFPTWHCGVMFFCLTVTIVNMKKLFENLCKSGSHFSSGWLMQTFTRNFKIDKLVPLSMAQSGGADSAYTQKNMFLTCISPVGS